MKVRRNRSPIEDVIRGRVWIRETREGWAGPCSLLKLRQIGTFGVHIKGVLLGWFVMLVVSVEEKFVLPWMLYSRHSKICCIQNIFFSSPHSNFILSVPFALQAGQAVVLGHLPLNMCLWSGKARAELLYFTSSGLLYPSKEYIKK